MKHTIIIFVLSACAFVANAKTNVSKATVAHDPITRLHKPLADVGFELSEDVLTFSQLPSHAISMYILDEQGHLASSGTVTRKNNTVSVKELQAGMYTIVLKQGGKVKMFGYYTGTVVKSHRINY